MRFFLLCCAFFIYSIHFAQLIQYEKINSFTVSELNNKWKKFKIPKIISSVKYAVDIYDVTYYTKNHNDSMVRASGLYFVPLKANDSPMLVYNHGTRVNPNNRDINCNREGLLCLMFATDGYSVLEPDYIGLGNGDGMHLYLHASTEADAGIYFMKAVEEINSELGIVLNQQLFITGYSQGGHATLALHKKLEEEYSVDYQVTASSPMSGPYDPLEVQAQVMFDNYTQPHYLPYLLVSYNEVYNMFSKNNFYDIFIPPYDSVVFKYFSNTKSFGNDYLLDEINASLPSIPVDMLKKEIVDLYKLDFNFFKKFIKENNVYDWKPIAPVQLCYCKSDEEVLAENSLLAYRVMRQNGSKNITKQCVSRKYNHVECAGFSTIHTKYFFDSFRKGSVKGRKGPVLKRFFIKLAKIFR